MEYSYKFRLYPTKAQEQQMQRTFGCCRYVYNHYLAQRIDAYRQDGQTLNYHDCCKDLTQLKHTLEWLREVDSTALQSSLRDLDIAYQNFFRRVKKGGEKPGFPKFKSRKSGKKSYKSRCTGTSIRVLDKAVQLPKLGAVKCRISKKVQGRILSATVSQNPSGKYFVSLCCTDVEMEQLPSTGAVVGVDLGLRYLAYTSDNRKYENPKPLNKSLRKLARMQRALSRKTIGSANYNRAKHRVARLHEHIANQRRDAQHKLTTALVREYDLICAESLNIRKMLQQSPYLARQISDAGWGEILRQFSYKCAWQHKPFVQIDALFPSTQVCNVCGYRNKALRKRFREQWECPCCGAIHDVDLNAAKNILNEGLRLLS